MIRIENSTPFLPTIPLPAIACALCLFLPLLAPELAAAEEGLTPRTLAVDPSTESPMATISVDQIRRGQKGWGLSVFEGRDPVRFEIEVIGLWHARSLEMSFLLARLSGQDLERSGILGGMSGSPVYVDDHLVGAVAFSFPFGLDPIAGITPIDAMRRLSGASGGLLEGPAEQPPTVPAASPFGSGTGLPTLAELATQDFDVSLLEGHLERLRPKAADALGGGRPALTWAATGFGEPAAELIRGALGAVVSPVASLSGGTGSLAASLAASGTASVTEPEDEPAREPADLEPGDAVSLVLMRGDLELAAHGTVTDRWGDEILAFGHPVFALGPTRLPMAESEVITTIASVANSFKLSNSGDLIGVFDQDREAGAHGVLGAEAPMMPVEIRLRGLVEKDYRMEVADAPLFRPTLLALGTLGALTSGSYATGFQGFDLEATFRFAEREDLVLRQSFHGVNAAGACAVYVLTYATFLDFNELGQVELESVELEIVQSERPRAGQLVAVRAERDRVEPGDVLGLQLEVQPFRGEPERRRVEVEIPDTLESGTYYLMVGDGASIDAARLAVEKSSPRTFEQSLDVLRSFHSRSELRTLGLTADAGVTVGGETFPGLPASLRGLYAQAGVGQALALRIVGEAGLPTETPLEGIHRVDLEVRRPQS